MAATAYAALRSLLTTVAMEQTPSPLHPRPFPFPSPLIHSLLETVRFLVEFLEQDYCTGAKHLLYRITHLAYAAEDAIQFPILQLIRSRTAISLREELVPVPMGKDLEIIIQGLQDVLLLMKDKRIGFVQDVHPAGDFRSSGSSSSSSTAPTQMDKTQMVGFEEDRSAIIVELTRYDQQHRRLQIIPIVGMGGIGKTTLARNVYDDDHIMKHFDVRAWVTVSQQYNVDDILKGLLSSLPNPKKTQEISRELQLYQSLIGRRYLVVFDDMWSTDVWDEIRQNFPDNNNGDRIIVTTRLSNLVAAELSTGFSLEMKCLDVENSWNLFCEKVFPSKSCPLELQDVGRKIVRNCGGLPLAIAVIGGLLAKSNQTLKYWEHVAEDFHSCLYSSDDDHCSKILFLSYDHLPIHLKPCLLYFGVFREDEEIPVSQLMSLWIAEGFLKPPVDKTLDANAIAEEYLKDLVERNLIMVSHYSRMGKIKKIIIHDLLRDLCLREVQNDMFYCVVTDKSIEVPAHQRRIVIGGIPVNETLFSDGPYSLGAIRHVRALLFTMPKTYWRNNSALGTTILWLKCTVGTSTDQYMTWKSKILLHHHVWNPVEGEFRCLKFLKMVEFYSLKKWNADCTHFPRLEILILKKCSDLEEIPLDFREISTLRLIKLWECPISAMKSALKILKEQQSFENEDLVVEVSSTYKYRSIHGVEIKNFVATSSTYYAEVFFSAHMRTCSDNDDIVLRVHIRVSGKSYSRVLCA